MKYPKESITCKLSLSVIPSLPRSIAVCAVRVSAPRIKNFQLQAIVHFSLEY